MNKWLAAFVLVLFLLPGCSDRKAKKMVEELETDSVEVADTTGIADEYSDELIAEEPMPVTADELFDDFIFNFAANRKLQLERTVFPLPVDSAGEQEHITRRQWKMERFFMHQDYYTLIFDSPGQMELMKDTAVQTAVVEKIFLNEKFVRQYHFDRRQGHWLLTGIQNQPLQHNANAQFLSFYQKFSTDSVFQHESLSDEIEFVGPDPEDDFEQMEGVITPDFWDAFRPELPEGMLYNVVYGQLNPAALQKIFVIRGIANGLEVEMTFRLHNGIWKLTKMIT